MTAVRVPDHVGRQPSGRGMRQRISGAGLLLAGVAALGAACSQSAVPTSATSPRAGTAPTSAKPTTAAAGMSPSAGASGRPAPSISGAPVPLHAPLALQAPGHLPGEGRFKAVITRNGQPVLQVAYLRADGAHGSDEAGVVWFDQAAMRFELHPGWADPGNLSLWNQPDIIPVSERPALAATFNGGFKTPELRGGFYENGHVAGKLLSGLASVVIYRDGHVALGSWGSEVSMTPQVVAVRQNLSLLIDRHRIVPGLDSNVEADWGPTIGGGPDVWRSGVGVTASGDFVLVMGDALTPQTLANLLYDAGAVRGMEMDINPAWMSFMWYTPSGNPAAPNPHKLVNFQRPANRYFTHTSRDFFAIYLR